MTRTFDRAHRRTNPTTSALADARITDSGKRENHCRQIVGHLVDAFVHLPDMALTHGEIAAEMEWEVGKVNKRMKDCLEKGPWIFDGQRWMVRLGAVRTCRVRGTEMQTYYAEMLP